MFVSNGELRNLLELATNDEKLALTKILDNYATTPYEAKRLQEEISLAGGHAIANGFRGQGTGYLDILDDVADALEINDRQSYESVVKYFDEALFLKDGKHTSQEATRLGLDYASKLEEKIIVTLIKKSYELMIKQKEDAEKELLKSEKAKSAIVLDIKHQSVQEKEIKVKMNFESNSEKKEELENQRIRLQNAIQRDITKEQELKKKIVETSRELKEVTKRIDDFDDKVNEVVKDFDVNQLGKLTGTAGIMVLANLGGFATYTFLTSMMSVVSFGTLGFGAYTAATSLLSIMIGPVGWAGLGLLVIFTFGKAKMSQLMPIVATVGAIRQRVKYEVSVTDNITPYKLTVAKVDMWTVATSQVRASLKGMTREELKAEVKRVNHLSPAEKQVHYQELGATTTASFVIKMKKLWEDENEVEVTGGRK